MKNIFLTFFRGLLMVIALWQCIGLLPVITWVLNPEAVNGEMVAVFILKFGVLTICCTTYYFLNKYMRKNRTTRKTVL
jgi:uncharacterized membrane protein YqjE